MTQCFLSYKFNRLFFCILIYNSKTNQTSFPLWSLWIDLVYTTLRLSVSSNYSINQVGAVVRDQLHYLRI